MEVIKKRKRRKKFKNRCQSLNSDGKQCREIAVGSENYHGDNEIYCNEEGKGWVKVYFCQEHLRSKK